jgi:hypothetical protein
MTWNPFAEKNLERPTTILTILGEQLYTDQFDRSFIKLTAESYHSLNKLCNTMGRSPFSDTERQILKLAGGDPDLDEHFVCLAIKVKPYVFEKNESPIEGTSVRLYFVKGSLAIEPLNIN